MTAVIVRSARLADADRLAGLFDQLGHPQTEAALRHRLTTTLADPRAAVLVADEDGAVVGAATCFFVPVAHDARPWCRITTLVVDTAHRGHGSAECLWQRRRRPLGTPDALVSKPRARSIAPVHTACMKDLASVERRPTS
jgi:predicted N-acetyltransferase YhbS